mmetsp:Transcript_40285/g.65299  ORF Transcript_40285/g.65299 Transcript_40285/m.65299 type:complete len:279 (+) Transcript_40285:186-1022(+)
MGTSQPLPLPEQILALQVHDFLLSQKLARTAAIFEEENEGLKQLLSSNISLPEGTLKGFLREWWFVFYDLYAAKLHLPHSSDADYYLKAVAQSREQSRKAETQQRHVASSTSSNIPSTSQNATAFHQVGSSTSSSALSTPPCRTTHKASPRPANRNNRSRPRKRKGTNGLAAPSSTQCYSRANGTEATFQQQQQQQQEEEALGFSNDSYTQVQGPMTPVNLGSECEPTMSFDDIFDLMDSTTNSSASAVEESGGGGCGGLGAHEEVGGQGSLIDELGL